MYPEQRVSSLEISPGLVAIINVKDSLPNGQTLPGLPAAS